MKRTVIVCAVAILALLPLVLACGCLAPAPLTGRIAFASSRDGHPQVYGAKLAEKWTDGL